MMSSMLVIIGNDITKMIIFPPNKTLSPRLELPVSLQIPAVNSAKYPMPIILKIMEYSEVFVPEILKMFPKISKILER